MTSGLRQSARSELVPIVAREKTSMLIISFLGITSLYDGTWIMGYAYALDAMYSQTSSLLIKRPQTSLTGSKHNTLGNGSKLSAERQIHPSMSILNISKQLLSI
jgi:hypothetical protein